MNKYISIFRLSFALFAAAAAILVAGHTAYSQTEKLGAVGYSAPQGWTKTANENIVAFSKFDKSTGKFCIITLYGATPGTGKPETDFKREWTNLVVKNMKAEPNPKTETDTDAAAGWTATAGGAEIESEAGPAFALLTVISGGGRTVSVLGVFNDPTFTAALASFSDSIQLGRAEAAAPTTPAYDPNARAAPPATVSMNAAGLVKEFENNEIRANQQYIGKRVRITGTVNVIEINSAGQIVLTFKSSVTTYRNARCYFNKSQSARVGALNAHEEATVEGRVKGLGDGFDNSKAYLVLEDCIVP